MSKQPEGRIIAAVFLAGLVAIGGLGLVGHAQHSGTQNPFDLPRQRPEVLRRGSAATDPMASPRGIPPASRSSATLRRGATVRPQPPAPAVGQRVPTARLTAPPAGDLPSGPLATAGPMAVEEPPLFERSADRSGRSRAIVLVQHITSDESPREPGLAGPSTGPGAEPRDPDADAIDWPEAATGHVPPLDASSAVRRGPVATWIRDSLDDIKATRSGVVPFPPRQAAVSGGRLIDRIRTGERILPRDRAEPRSPRAGVPPHHTTGAVGWPAPVALLQLLDHPISPDCERASAWSAEAVAAVRGVMATDGPTDPAAAEPLAALGSVVAAGMKLADANPESAPAIRRAALSLQRREVTWAAASTFATGATFGRAEPDAIPGDGDRLVALLHRLERYDAAPTPADAAAAVKELETIEAGGDAAAAAFVAAVRSQYDAANVRVAMHQKFIQRILPPTQVTSAPVDDTVLGRQVRGTSRVAQTTGVRFAPDPDGISVILEVRGDVASRTVTESGPVALTSRGSSSFTVNKPLTVDQGGLQLGQARGSASSRSQLADIQTSFDGVPIMRSLVRNIARNQHDEHLPEANREVIDKIVARACREVDQQVEPQLIAAAERIRSQAWGPLIKLGLDPTPVSLETTGEIAMARLRLAAVDQFAAHTPRPRAPSGSMLSLQVHESAVNNGLERLGLAGRRLALEDLVKLLCDRAGVEPRVPDDLPEDVAVTFATVQPLRVQYRDGLVQVRVALDAIESGRRGWHDIVASVTYRPKADSQQIYLEREGPIHLGGPGHQGRAEIALRAVFGKIFPKDRPLPLLPESFVSNPRLADVKVLQAVSADGWLAISLGELPTTVSPVATKVATPAPARRLLRR